MASDVRHSLLVVDDERAILDSLQSLFRRSYDVHVALTGAAGIEILARSRIQIILSDQRMADMLGDEFLARALEMSPDSIRILFTGYADIDSVTRAVNRGRIWGYVSKPWNTPELETLIKQAARQFDVAQSNRELTKRLREANVDLEHEVFERTRELHDLQDYKDGLLQSLGGGMLVIDLGGMVTSANPAAAAMLGVPAASLSGASFRKTPRLAPFAAEIELALARGMLGEYQETAVDPGDGTPRYVGFVVNPLRLRTGERRGAIVSLSDITDKRQMEMQLNQSEKLSAIGQLAGGVAHEINNPLGVILGFAQILLKQTGLEEANMRRLQQIERQALRCKEIVGNLLKFSRRSKMEAHPVEINRVLEETLALMGKQLEIEQIRLTRTLAPHLPEVTGDEIELEQVFFNLVVNARHAMIAALSADADWGPMELEIVSRRSGEAVEVLVSDSGPGVPPALREKIFDPFFTTKEPGRGTGLGLSVSRGIIRRHGGDLHCEDRLGGGTTFVVRLPASQQPSVPLPEVIAPATIPVRGLKILVVDDEDDIRQLCVDYLSEQNDVVSASSGSQAIQAVLTGRFELVLLDVMMPEMDGVTTLEKIRAMGCEVPVVIMTGRADERIVGVKERLGVFEVMEKPFSIDELDWVLDRATGRKK